MMITHTSAMVDGKGKALNLTRASGKNSAIVA
jgi:hypothetical protein